RTPERRNRMARRVGISLAFLEGWAPFPENYRRLISYLGSATTDRSGWFGRKRVSGCASAGSISSVSFQGSLGASILKTSLKLRILIQHGLSFARFTFNVSPNVSRCLSDPCDSLADR